MFSRNSVYPLSRDGTFSAHIYGDHDQVSSYMSYYRKEKLGWIGKENALRRYAEPKHLRFDISAKQDLPLLDSQIGASEPPLFSVILHGLLLN